MLDAWAARLRATPAMSALVVAGVALLLLAEGLHLAAAWLPSDELGTLVGARAPGAGPFRAGVLLSAVLSPFAQVLSAPTLYWLARVLCALLWAATFIPAFALARRVATPAVAAVAAGVAVIVPASVYGLAVVPDALAYVLATTALALVAGAGAVDSRRRRQWIVALSLAVALARPPDAAFALALGCWAVGERKSWSRVAVWPRSLVVAAAAGVLYAVWTGIGAGSVSVVGRAALASVGAAVAGVAVAPWLAAWAGSAPGDAQRLRRLLAYLVPLLALAAGLVASSQGRLFDERPLLLAAPLVLALAAAALSAGPLRVRAAGLAAAASAVCIVAARWPAEGPAVDGAPSLSLLYRLVQGPKASPLGALLFVAAGLLVLRARRPARALATTGLVVALAQLTAWSSATAVSRGLAPALPAPRDAVDRAAHGAHVTWVLAPNILLSDWIDEVRVWNGAIRDVRIVDPAAAGPTGTLAPGRFGDVLATKVSVAGTTVAQTGLGPVIAVGGRLVLGMSVSGLYPDGWSGREVVYTQFAGPHREASLDVTLSRAVWTGPDKPGHIVVNTMRLDSTSNFAERLGVIHSGETLTLTIKTPPPPFRAVVTIDPTFSPADYGQPDARQLGAHVSFVNRAS